MVMNCRLVYSHTSCNSTLGETQPVHAEYLDVEAKLVKAAEYVRVITRFERHHFRVIAMRYLNPRCASLNQDITHFSWLTYKAVTSTFR